MSAATSDSSFHAREFHDPSACSIKDEDKERECTDKKTYLLTINQEAYQKDFNQSSPLDRSKLATLINDFKKIGPAVLAIDLDLSPNPQENKYDGELTTALKELAGTGETEVILLVPNPNFTPEKKRNPKTSWMCDLLTDSNHIYFGLGTINTLDGMTLKYVDAHSTIAYLIYSHTHGPFNQNEKTHQQSTLSQQTLLTAIDGRSCNNYSSSEVLSAPTRLDLLLNRRWRNAVDSNVLKGELAPFNFQYAGLPVKQQIPWRPDADNIKQLAQLKGQVVILGGDYGLSDYYNTPLGRQAGVKLHYAAYYSMVNRLTEDKNHIISFALDVLIGVVFSFIFHHLLHLMIEYFSLRLILVAIVLAVMALLASLSYWLLITYNLWLKPAPLILGIVLHSLIDFIRGKQKKVEARERKGLLKWMHIHYQKLDQAIYIVFLYGIIIFSVILLFTSH